MGSEKKGVARAAPGANTSPIRMTTLHRTAEPLLISDKPWEEFTIDWVNVIN